MGTNIGAELSIATGLPATFDQIGYEALTWEPLVGTLNIPAIGDSRSPIKSTLLKTGRTKNSLGSATLGDLTVTFREEATDDGLDDVRAANVTDTDYSFRVSYPNASTRTIYFYGKVTDLKENEATADSEAGGSFMILTNSAPFETNV